MVGSLLILPCFLGARLEVAGAGLSCEGVNRTAAQCAAIGGAANKCCFFLSNQCYTNSRISVGDECLVFADEGSCEASACCSWIGGMRCGENRDKLGCKTGVEACACQGFDEAQCLAIGCCQYTDGYCESAVGHDKCVKQPEAPPTALSVVKPTTIEQSKDGGGATTLAAVLLALALAAGLAFVARQWIATRRRRAAEREAALSREPTHEGIVIDALPQKE